MPNKEKGWSKEARSKGYGVEKSAVDHYKNRGILAFKIPNASQVYEWSKIDYIVILKGIIGQAKYKREYLKNGTKDLILDMVKNYPNSELKAELAHRGKKYARVKFEYLNWEEIE